MVSWGWTALSGCLFSVPARLDDGAPTPGCAPEGVSAERLLADVATLAREPRRSLERRAEVRAWLAERWTALGYTVEERPFTIAGVRGTNVVASGPAGGTVWVGAHYDSVASTPGADDDASGVAAVLELARVLGPEVPVRYVLFDAEEPHDASVGREGRNYAFGSQAFVDALGPGEASAAFVLESIGRACETCQQLPPGVPSSLVKVDGTAVYWVVDEPSAAPWADLVATARAAVPTRPAHAVGFADRGDDLPQSRFSDHAPFWDAGIPAVMVTDTAMLRNADYHRPGDTADRIDGAYLADATTGVGAAVRELTGRCRATP